MNESRPKMILTVAITGTDTTPSQSPYIPITPDEIAEECHKCWKAGAAAVHLHVRNPEDGSPTSDMGRWEEMLTKTKALCPDLIIGVTTGGAYGQTIDQRLEVVTRFKPEIASMTPESVSNTLHHVVPRVREWKYEWEKPYLMSTYSSTFSNSTEQYERFAEVMRENGTKPECEFFSGAGLQNAKYLYRDGKLDDPLFLQFVLGVRGGTGAHPAEVVHLQTEALRMFGHGNFHWSVIGVGYPRQYTLGALAMSMFGHVRVGMEDNIYRRKGVLCQSNLEMVEDIKTIAEIFGRELASPDEAREMLNLKGADKVEF
jgi:uncharacterized protein (DUF849 family)